MIFLWDIKNILQEKKMTKEELLESMELIIKSNKPDIASQLIWVLWMDHANYKILGDKVIHKDTEKPISVK